MAASPTSVSAAPTRMTAPKSAGTKFKMHRMSIEQADNGGFTVEHHFKPEKPSRRGEPDAYKPSETHVFADFGAMHNHIPGAFGQPAPPGPANAQEPEEEAPAAATGE